MAFEVVPTAAGRLHSDQYTKIIIINTPINLQSSLDLTDQADLCCGMGSEPRYVACCWMGHNIQRTPNA